MTTPVLSVRGLHLSYGAAPILTDLSFGMSPGEHLLLLAPFRVGIVAGLRNRISSFVIILH